MARWNIGAKNGFWKGGRSLASNGYVLVRVGRGHRLADVRGYAYEHRIIAERMLGRMLRKGEQVHHRNGDKADNREANLEVFSSAAYHGLAHRKSGGRRLPDEPNPHVSCACGCGKSFPKYDGSGRPRRYITGHNMIAGSRGAL